MLPAPYPPKPHREPDFIPSIPNPTGAADNWQNLRPPPSLGFPSSRMRAAGGGRRKRRRKKKRRRAGAARPCAVPAGERWAAPQSAHAGLCARTSRPRNRRSPSPETFHHLSPQSRAEQAEHQTRLPWLFLPAVLSYLTPWISGSRCILPQGSARSEHPSITPL